ncbi:MAG: alpha/beta hydrolase, partial [Candidatus Sulfotelmatobacter sp.]
TQVPADAAVVLIYNMIAVKDISAGLAKMNRPVLFAYQPDSQGSADFLKSKLGDKLRLERFDGDGHALFVDDAEKFNRVLEEFIHNLPK